MDTEHICSSCRKPLPAGAPQGLCPACLMKAGFGSGVAPEPGQPSRTPPFVPPPVAEVAKLFPQFEIMELLGQGGMGAVYKARQPALDRLVALKILPPETGADTGFADRFTREARALARLSHPNIVAVHEFGQAGGLHYFVMEYVEGLNLRQLEQAGRLSPREALKIIPQICDALQFAHDEGIVHRDIKPENVMLDKKGRVKITDFGLAKLLGREPTAMRLTGAKDVMGTPHYMAPEQIEHPQEVDHRADIYSLGVVFYEMLTGELPLGKFQAPSRKVQVDVRLDEVVLHALEKEPERRYQQASQVKTDVETIAATAPKMSIPAQDSPRLAQPPVLGPRQQEAPRFTAESVRQQYLVLAIAWWIGYPVSIVSEFVVWLNVITVPALITAAVFWFILLYRHWSLLQGHGARTTPGKAVGYGFIPIFWFYWWFVAYAGLATDNNRYLRQSGISSRRMSYGLAVTSCILGCLLCTVGWFPVGWAILIVPYMIIGFILVVQQRDCVLAMLEARTLTAQPQGETAEQRTSDPYAGRRPSDWTGAPSSGPAMDQSLLTSAATGPEPRFSRTAIVGACWSAFAVFAALCWPIGKAVDAAGQMPIRLSLVLLVTLVSLGVTSLLGTTILGAVAISQIRHSQGRLYGLGLAVFDVLLFPLLALNGGLIGGWIWLGDQVGPEWIPQLGRGWFFVLVVGLMITSCVVASWLIIRTVWQAANRAPGGGQFAPNRPASSGGAQFFPGPAWYVGIIAGLALVAGLIAWGMWERRSAVSPGAVVGIEEKLARELKARVIAADFGVASVSVNIDRARRDRAECLIGGLVKYWGTGPQKPGTQRLYSDVSGGGTFRHEGSGLWSFVGNGSLQKLRFHVDASAEMSAGQALETGPGTSYEPGRVAVVEQKLTREAGERLRAANYAFDHLFVNVRNAQYDNVECEIRGLRKPAGEGLSNGTPVQLYDAVSGGLDFVHQGKGMWTVRGSGTLSNLNFTVDTSAEMGPLRKSLTAFPKPFQYSEPEAPDPAEVRAAAGASLPFGQAKPGEFKVGLTNGLEFEVLAVASSPRSGSVWWRPDGTLLPDAPGDRLGAFPTLCPNPKASAEFALLTRRAGEFVPERELLLAFEPRPQYVTSTDLYKGSQAKGRVTLIGFGDVVPGSLICKIGLADGAWERVATWDQAGVLLKNESGSALQLIRSGADGQTCLKLNHNLDPNKFALRLVARLKNGEDKTARLCRVDYAGLQNVSTCSLIQNLPDSDVVAYELYRLPLRWARVSGIATRPAMPPLEERQAAAILGPENEVVLTEFNNRDGQEALDLDSGKVYKQPKDMDQWSEAEFIQWVTQNGIDVLVDHGLENRWGVMTTLPAALRLGRVTNEKWAGIGLEELLGALANSPLPLEVIEKENLRIVVPPKDALAPVTLAFKTSAGGLGLLQIAGFTDKPRGVKIRYKLVRAPSRTVRLEDSYEADRARAVALFNDIEDFGHEFETAFASKSLPAAETGTRRLLNLLSNFNAVVKGTGYEFSSGIFKDIGKVQQALKGGDWDKVQQAARGNDAYRREFKRIAARMVELAREQPADAVVFFGPVIERVVAGAGDANKRFIDLDKGRLFAASEYFGPKAEPSPEETQKWLTETGIDAVADTRSLYGGLVGFNLVAAPVPNEEWDRLPPSKLDYYLAMSAPGTPVVMSGKGELPVTFAVRTREGARGLLQVVSLTTNPPAVGIRYKLVQSGATRSALQASNSTQAALTGPAAPSQAEDTRATLQSLLTAALTYEVDRGKYPSALDELVKNPGGANWRGPYARAAAWPPLDAWGMPLRYSLSGSKDSPSPVFRSAGPDRTFGTSDDLSSGCVSAEDPVADGNITASFRLVQPEPARRYWRWQIQRPVSARLIYGVLDVTDLKRPQRVVMGMENYPAQGVQDYGLRVNPERDKWKVEVEDAWAGNGGRGAVWEYVRCQVDANLADAGLHKPGVLTTTNYSVLWKGELSNASRKLKSLWFVARLAEANDPAKNILDASDAVRSFDGTVLPEVPQSR